MLEDNIQKKRQLIVSGGGFINQFYDKVISMLNKEATNISNFMRRGMFNSIYQLDINIIMVSHDRNINKMTLEVYGDNSLNIIRRLNSLDPDPINRFRPFHTLY